MPNIRKKKWLTEQMPKMREKKTPHRYYIEFKKHWRQGRA